MSADLVAKVIRPYRNRQISSDQSDWSRAVVYCLIAFLSLLWSCSKLVLVNDKQSSLSTNRLHLLRAWSMRFKELLCKPVKDHETARMLTILSTELWTPFARTCQSSHASRARPLLFVLESSIRHISPKWQLIRRESKKGTTCEQHNWKIDPLIPTNQTED